MKRMYSVKKYILSSPMLGKFKKYIYQDIFAKNPFDRWHFSTIDEREYAYDLVLSIDELSRRGCLAPCPIVEVGCGLGEIISGITIGSRNSDPADQIHRSGEP